MNSTFFLMLRPVVVAMSASAPAVTNYAAGILDDYDACCPNGNDCRNDLDHAVVVVGYNKSGEKKESSA